MGQAEVGTDGNVLQPLLAGASADGTSTGAPMNGRRGQNIRVVPRLDIKGPNLVKGINLEGLRVLGEPGNFSSSYYGEGADEIFFMDCVASLYGRNSLSDVVRRTAESLFVPLTVGGGIRSIGDIRDVLRSGADKVCINTAAVKNPQFVADAVSVFGASTIVVAIEAIRQSDGTYHAFTDNGREETGLDVVGWARTVEDMGAGELVITSVDRDGTGEGFDIPLIRSITDEVRIPVIAHGGAATIENTVAMIEATNVSAVCISSAFHYDLLDRHRGRRAFRAEEGNTSFLNGMSTERKAKTFGIGELKAAMASADLGVRIAA